MIQRAGCIAESALQVVLHGPDKVELGWMEERANLKETPVALPFLAEKRVAPGGNVSQASL